MVVTFLLTSFVIVATPGTGALFTLAAGLTRGARASVLAAFACTLGTVPHMVAAITGLAAVLHASGVALNLLNPKLTIFFFAFLPQFVPAGRPGSLPTMLVLSGVFMAMTFVVFVGYGLAAAALRDKVLGRPRLVQRIRKGFAVTFAVLAGRLAVQTR